MSESRNRLAKLAYVGKFILQVAFIPFIIYLGDLIDSSIFINYLGYMRSVPRPPLMRLISPLA